ncbi:signal peptidase II [Allosphingosinicella deserti]|uniref:Lipoprotein signal peptidase n=1 Tax=Allosphingosinicella deserti TaxID=2116704 RepID=A0A2P7QJ03_9SPHN|nr:signal peptidase II [Sphingomonas deserti]PSJ37910.1 signal peptidase II [Sphingomonas deserti]
MSRRVRSGLLLAAVFVLLTVDQMTKLWAYSALTASSSISLPGPVDLTLVFNRSNAFGLMPVFGEVTRWMLVGLNVAVASALAYLVWSREQTRAAFLACAFIIAGGIGNAIDRMWLGAVIDMFDASEVGFNWVFNVADVFIDIGIGLWLLHTFLGNAERDQPKTASTSHQPQA